MARVVWLFCWLLFGHSWHLTVADHRERSCTRCGKHQALKSNSWATV